MPTPEQQALARRLREGDEVAFEEFVRRYNASAFRLARRLLRHDDDALEVVQESLLAAYEGRSKYRGEAAPGSWLLSITYNKAVDRLKERNRFDVYDEDNGALNENWQRASMVRNITDWWRNPEQHFSDGQLRAHLDTALSNLPVDSRAVFELRELQGMSSREVADAVQISEAAVRVRLHRVRQYLIAALQEAFDRQRRTT